MKTLIVGGNFGDIPKSSSVIKKLTSHFLDGTTEIINGGTISDLPHDINSDLIIWAPNIDNESPKQYPKKSNGNVLICSKVMREGYTTMDAITRIFKMQGNAVIAIYPGVTGFKFQLIDALGNTWIDTDDISVLADTIKGLYTFTKESIRVGSKRVDVEGIERNDDLSEFIEVNKSLSEYIQTSCGERFFGNLSTRCMKLFPSLKTKKGIFVSPRNVNKEHLTSEDMVFVEMHNGSNEIIYSGPNKPSIDTPIQLKLYEHNIQINYMIHGHAFVKGAPTTEHYYVCGDLREFDDVNKLINGQNYGIINLKNHGFLIYGYSLEIIEMLIDNSEFYYDRK